MIVFLAELITTHFDFQAIGATEEEARQALERGWQGHRREYSHAHVSPFSDFAEEVRVTEMKIGEAYRDQERITR